MIEGLIKIVTLVMNGVGIFIIVRALTYAFRKKVFVNQDEN